MAGALRSTRSDQVGGVVVYRRAIARLILLNGPPASGKSTLAAQFADAHPLTLNLDIDVVRGLLGGWATDPADAGRLARSMAIGMAAVALRDGRDVIVPQLLARPAFIGELEQLAELHDVEFVEVALAATRDEMHAWFAERSAAAAASTHRDAQLLVEQTGGADALDQLYDGFTQLVASRPRTRVISARRGDLAASVRALEDALAR